MLKLVRQLMKPEKQQFRIEVLNIITPGVMIGTWDSSCIPTSEEYIELERHMARVWSHAPGWKFPDLPSEGTLVMAMLKHKSNFKRGVVLRVEVISGTRVYFVFLYDWGIIERLTFDDLAQLPPEDEHRLLPRTFLVLHAGMVKYRVKKIRSKRRDGNTVQAEDKVNEIHEIKLSEDNFGRGGRRNGSSGPSLFEANEFARNWFDSRSCYMQMYKNFQGIVFICDVKSPMVQGDGRVKDLAFVYLMEVSGFTSIDRKLRREDKDHALSNWDSIVGRLEGIEFEKVIKTKTEGSGAGSYESGASDGDSGANERPGTSSGGNTSR